MSTTAPTPSPPEPAPSPDPSPAPQPVPGTPDQGPKAAGRVRVAKTALARSGFRPA